MAGSVEQARKLLVDAPGEAGEFEIYAGISAASAARETRHRTDTPIQRWFWQFASEVSKQESANGTWNSDSLIQKFTPTEQQELFFGEINKRVSRV